MILRAENLVKNGTKEIMLIAQDSTYYGLDLYGERRLKELLDRMNDPMFLQEYKDSADEDPKWTIPELNAFYTHSIKNEESILKSDFCGCFHCISIFPVADIKEMVVEKDGFKTAICPICGIDAVLGDASVEITAEILEVLNEHFF